MGNEKAPFRRTPVHTTHNSICISHYAHTLMLCWVLLWLYQTRFNGLITVNLPVVPRLSQCYRDRNMKDQFSFVIMYPSCSKESFSVHTVSIMLDGPDQSTLVTLWFCLLFPCLLEWKWSIDRLDHWLRFYMLLHCLVGKVGQLIFPRMGRTYCVECCNVENASKHQWNLKLTK